MIASRKKAMHTITHELRTPLTAIHGYAELMQDNEEEKISGYADNILQASKRMTDMLNSLLDFFRLDSGKEQANVRPFRLENIAELLQTEFTQQAEAKDLKLTIECRRYYPEWRQGAHHTDMRQPAGQCRQVHECRKRFTCHKL
ncbi:hypothetical protein BFINE_44850 [Bacteroides finegoldii DSM 17565]|nr:hypothetical protein BFINE_44850 [Bacteroides finegoldii DSM 17565]